MSFLSFINRFSGLFVALMMAYTWSDYCKVHELPSWMFVFGFQFIAWFFGSNLLKGEN